MCRCEGHRRSGSYGNVVVTTATSASTISRPGVPVPAVISRPGVPVPAVITVSGSLENVSLLSQNHNVVPTTRSVSWTPSVRHQGIVVLVLLIHLKNYQSFSSLRITLPLESTSSLTSSATSWSASSWFISSPQSSHLTSVIITTLITHHPVILPFQTQNFPISLILPSIDIWHLFGLISRIPGLHYGFFSVSVFSSFQLPLFPSV